ncbi:MAG: leucyl aminopeptidase [Gammaproteobacteria bacterium RBG_16_51_14]|nr:MAG: leucyl aminopeptidase [Gammaproteobacteria bacterium RBG_16_51_14]
MEFGIKSGNPEKQRTACVIVGISETRRLSAAAKAVDDISNKYISNLIRRGDIEGKAGQMLLLHNVPGMIADRVLLIGCGRERDMNEREYRKVIAYSIRCLNQTGSMEAVSYLTDLNIKGRDYYWKIKQAVLVTGDTLYRFDELKTKKNVTRRPLRKIIFTVPTRRELPPGERAITEGQAIATGMKLTRDLANRPANICTPGYLAGQARQLVKLSDLIQVKVHDEAEMKKMGMHTLLSVARGTHEPAKLITIEYKGAKKNSKPIVLIGKGVTFDTGGISIKPALDMDEMKYDMCGAAAVLGTLYAVARLALPLHIVGIIPATENMPGGSATKPGDIITSLSGQTVEVLNTDAEGRLILCDALTYSERFNPEIVIDIATLTGACVIALGRHATGLLSNHNALARDLLNAGETSGDRAWQLPLWEEYQAQLKSPFADLANIGGRDAGTITAACFLSRFAGKFEWAHLDIAGTAWTSGKDKGATGRPVPLLMQYLLDKCS